MINPEDYRVTPETVDGGDVDLDAEAVLGLDGRRITEADIQAFTTARDGRPSLRGPLTAGVVPGARADPAAGGAARRVLSR